MAFIVSGVKVDELVYRAIVFNAYIVEERIVCVLVLGAVALDALIIIVGVLVWRAIVLDAPTIEEKVVCALEEEVILPNPPILEDMMVGMLE